MTAKSEVRRAVRVKLEQLAPADLAEKSARIRAAVVCQLAWQRAKTVCLFASHTHEPDIDPLWQHIEGKTVCYPRVVDERIELFSVADIKALKTSRWNLREPDHVDEKLVPLENVDVLLVPGVAFSRDGGRLGRGGGFYDRLLAQPQRLGLTVGICFDAQLVTDLPREPHDLHVDMVITENGALA